MNMNDKFTRLQFIILGSTRTAMSTNEHRRIKATCSEVPQVWNLIMDLGCGDGRVGNFLTRQGRRIIGADWSTTSLRDCKFDCFVCDIRTSWPLAISFDGIICAEVLEHLPQEQIESVLTNIRSNCRSGFIISVPACEPMEAHAIECQACRHYYNCWGHLHYFGCTEDVDRMVGMQAVERIFVPYHGVRPSLLFARWRRTLGCQAIADNSICPYCGKRPNARENRSILTRGLLWMLSAAEFLTSFLRPRTGWFICRYEVHSEA